METVGREAKRARSRQAAHSRRLHENSEFHCLAAVLPIPAPISAQLLDKASIVRLTISSIRLHRFAALGTTDWTIPAWFSTQDNFQTFESRLGTTILEAMDGFLFCLAPDGCTLYVSETVSIGLGLSQIDVIGNPFSDYVHAGDVPELRAMIRRLACKESSCEEICLRLRSTLSKRASKDAVRSSIGHKVVHVTAQARLDTTGAVLGIGGQAYTLPSPAAADLRLPAATFVLTTLLDLTVHYVEPWAEELLGYEGGATLKNQRMYQLVHPADLASLSRLHTLALKLGGSSSAFLRLANFDGSWVWAQIIAVRIHKHKARNSLNYITLACTMLGQTEPVESSSALAPLWSVFRSQ